MMQGVHLILPAQYPHPFFIPPYRLRPDMTQGVHFNILQNIWNTNYVLW